MSNHTWVCVPCREVSRSVVTCPSCKGAMITRYRWSPPKKNNDRAWRRVERGEWNWDHRRVRRGHHRHHRDDVWMNRPLGANRKRIIQRYVAWKIRKEQPHPDMGG